MNVKELREKALSIFIEWPYGNVANSMVGNLTSEVLTAWDYDSYEFLAMGWEPVFTRKQFEEAKADKDPLVYWDGKEDLQVGMIVEVCGFTQPYRLVLLPDDDGECICTPLYRKEWQRCELKHIKVFDTRSDECKAIEDLTGGSVLTSTSKLWLGKAYKAWHKEG